MNRRDILKLTATLATAPAGLAAQEEAAAKATAASWTPAVLDAHQEATVVALCELMIPATDTPGAKEAQVDRYVDLFLRDGPSEESAQFLDGLGWLDGYARRRFGHAFVSCTREQQTAVLEALSSSREPGLAPGRRFFEAAKDLIARIYYNTEAGYAELNKGGRVPGSFACRV